MTADLPPSILARDRLREQLQALERALSLASAAGSQGATGPSSGGLSSSSSSVGQPDCLTVQTAAGAVFDLAVPDLDSQLQPATSPRLACGGKVLVCTGRKCCAQGADETLAAARAAAAGSGVEVVGSKCMGKCGKGPCVRLRVEGQEGSALTRGVDAAAAGTLLRQQFGVTC